MQISSVRVLRFGAAVGVAVFFTGSSSARAQTTYDVATNWSDIVNPNGVWTYGLLDTNSVFTFFPNKTANYNGGDFSAQPAWINGNSPEGLGKRSGGTALDVPVGRVFGHTPVTNSYLAARWTAPSALRVNISGDTWMLRDLGRTDSVNLFVNNTLKFGDVTIPSQPSGTNSTNPYTLAQAAVAGGSSAAALQNVLVAPGDTITLAFRRVNEEDYVGMDFTLTTFPTPEPGGLALLVGLATSGGLLVRRKRR